MADVLRAVRERRQERWRKFCEPVTVVWSGSSPCLELRLLAAKIASRLECKLHLEGGGLWRYSMYPLPSP